MISYFIWIWNLGSHIKEMTQPENITEHDAEEDVTI